MGIRQGTNTFPDVGHARIGNEDVFGMKAGTEVIWRALSEPGEHPVTARLGLLPGTLATTALQASSITDPNQPTLNLIQIGSVPGGAYTNMVRLSYPSATNDEHIPDSLTVSRAATGGRQAYTATSTARSAITTRGGSKQADYEIPNNPVRMAFVQTNDSIQLTLAYATDTPGRLTVTGTRRAGRNPYGVTIVLTDTDGVRAITAATLTSNDGQVRPDMAGEYEIQSTTVRTWARDLRNARWASGTVSVTYTDGNGVSATLTGAWSITRQMQYQKY